MCMEDDEIVETSDYEESEALRATSDGYWLNFNSKRVLYHALGQQERLRDDGRTSSDNSMVFSSPKARITSSSRSLELGPPMKRMKFSHSYSSEGFSVVGGSSSRAETPPYSSSPMLALGMYSSSPQRPSSNNLAISNSGVAQPSSPDPGGHDKSTKDGRGVLQLSHIPSYSSLSQDEGAIVSPIRVGHSTDIGVSGLGYSSDVEKLSSPMASFSTPTRRRFASPFVSSPTYHQSNPATSPDIPLPNITDDIEASFVDDDTQPDKFRSRSSSVDPLSLFTPTRSRSPTGVNIVLQVKNEGPRSNDGSLDFTSLAGGNIPSTPLVSTSRTSPQFISSPLTPASSPHITNDSPPTLVVPLSVPQSPAPDIENRTPPPGPSNDESVAVQQAGRYSLRTRLAKQVNPYGYDKMLYKRLLRSNPEAIVKFASPTRRRRSRSAHDSDADDEFHSDSGDEADETQGGEESQSQHRRRHRRKSVSPDVARNHENRHSPLLHLPQNPEWHPKLFEETFSSSSGESSVSSLPKPTRDTSADKPPRKRTRKRFPMTKKDFLPILPIPTYDASEPTIASHPQTPPPPSIIDISSEETVAAPSPRPSVASSVQILPRSPSRVNKSPSREQSPHVYFDDGDEFVSSGSPLTGDPDPGPPGIDETDSNENDSDRSSDQTRSSPAPAKSRLSRKDLKVLGRMMPKILINKHINALPPSRVVRRVPADLSNSDDSSTKESDRSRPLLPGQSRVKIGSHGPNDSIRIKGDTESSDDQQNEDSGTVSVTGGSSTPSSEADVPGPARNIRHVVYSSGLSESEDDSINDGGAGDKEVDLWLLDQGSRMNTTRRQGSDLIDRMLSRTKISRPTGTKRVHKSTRTRRHRGTHVVTSGAKRIGPSRQTILPFKIDTTNQGTHHVEDQPSSVPKPQEAPIIRHHERRKNRNKPRSGAGLYVFSADGTHLESGRPHNHISTDAEVADRHGVSTQLWRHSEQNHAPPRRRRKPRSHRNLGPQTSQDLRLDDYWNPEPDVDIIPITRVEAPRRLVHQGDALRHITSDCNIPFLTSGMSFGPRTCLGQGWLFELISLFCDGVSARRPSNCSVYGFTVDLSLPSQDFISCLSGVDGDLPGWLSGFADDVPVEACHQWRVLLHAICQHASWWLEQPSHNDCDDVRDALIQHAAHAETLIGTSQWDDGHLYMRLEIQWHIVEVLWRVECHRRRSGLPVDETLILKQTKLLVQSLWTSNIWPEIASLINDLTEELDDLSESQRTVELWVCLIHLMHSLNSELPRGGHNGQVNLFWDLILQITRSEDLLSLGPSDSLESSEAIWQRIFCLCAISQFSVHGMTTSSPRLSASWTLTAFALARIRLAADPGDAHPSPRSIRKFDEYVRRLIARCLTLNQRWHWRLDDASPMFNRLLEIFKSRRFANLHDEPSDFPSFLRHNNLQLLFEKKSSDTAFTLFLKLIVQAAKDAQKDAVAPTLSPKIKKILIVAIPVGSVPFTKTTPPSGKELSMLYNRLSAIAVAIYLEPTVPNLSNRLAQARRYVNFKDTDHTTRRACIRGLMHLAILARHLHLPLDRVLEWLADMTNVLIDEYKELFQDAYTRNWVVICIQMLLGTARRIIETPAMDPDQAEAQYPDPALLQGPWVTRIFSNSTNLTNIAKTGVEARRLVQAFLDARAKVMPKPARPRPPPAEDSQESQDYGEFDLDMDDPELLAVLNIGVGPSAAEENRKKDLLVCELFDTHVNAAIYRLVCKTFNETTVEGPIDHYFHEADSWIDCWVGCANVVVQNRRRTWDFYLTLGPQSWERIIDNSWRRRVGLRFMFMLLTLDPSAYPDHKSRFVDVLLESMVTARVTIEHEYAALLFSVDRLRHPLFHGVLCEMSESSEDYVFTPSTFLEKRLSILQKMLTNLEGNLILEAAGDVTLTVQTQTCIGSVAAMLSAMQDVYQRFDESAEGRVDYQHFCRQVMTLLSQSAFLRTNERLVMFFNWGKRFLNI